MTKSELLQWLVDLPDDTLIVVHLGDGEWIESAAADTFPAVATLGLSPLAVIDTGQEVTDDAAYDAMARRGY